MAQRDRLHVNKRGDGRWEVEREGASRASAVTDTQAEAIARGREIAQNAGRSQLIIHRADGRIREERTYGGGDPHPPEG